VIAAVAAMIVGFIWHSQLLFGGLGRKIIVRENPTVVEQE